MTPNEYRANEPKIQIMIQLQMVCGYKASNGETESVEIYAAQPKT